MKARQAWVVILALSPYWLCDFSVQCLSVFTCKEVKALCLVWTVIMIVNKRTSVKILNRASHLYLMDSTINFMLLHFIHLIQRRICD